MTKAAIYARYSSDNQRDESIDAQLRAAHAYCARKNYQIIHEYIDRAQTATNDNRVEYQQMMADAKAGLFEVIVFHKIDRNARNEFDYYYHKTQLRKYSVRYEYVAQSIDDSPEGQMMEGIMVSFAAYTSRNLATEVKKGHRENAYQQMWNGGTPPLGYDVVDKRLQINEYEAGAVRMAFSMRGAGKTLTEVINALNAAGYRTKRGQPFKANSLHDILINEKYIGHYVFGKTTGGRSGPRNSHKPNPDALRFEDAIPAIIDIPTWQAVRARDTFKQKQSNQIETYLLSGLIRCSCGTPMSGSRVTNQKGILYVYYRCNNKQCKESGRIKRDKVEYAVIGGLAARLEDEETRNVLIDNITELAQRSDGYFASALAGIKKETAILDAKAARLLDAIENGGMSSLISNRLNDIEKQKVALQNKTARIKAAAAMIVGREQIAAVINDCAVQIKSNSPDKIRAVLDLFVDSVTVGKDDVLADYKFAPFWWRRGESNP